VSALPFVLLAEWSAVAVALPAIRLELGASATGVQLLLLALLVPPAVLLIPARRLGRRPAVGAGILLFASGGVVGALAGSVAALIGAGILQGVGAAAMLAHSGALRSPALQGAACGLALSIGPVAGGYLVETADWRSVFWLALPVAAVAALLALAGSQRPGLPAAGNAVAAGALLGAYATMALLVPQYGQLVLERSAPGSAVLLLPAGGALLVLSLPLARLARRLGARPLVVAGLACAAAGMLAVTFVDADTGLRTLLPGLLLLGVGLGLSVPPVLEGSAWNGTMVLAGSSLTLLAGGGLAELVQSGRRDGGATFDAAVSDGLAAAGWMLAAVLLLCAVLAALPQAKLVSSTPS
jgi:hypothetical protein